MAVWLPVNYDCVNDIVNITREGQNSVFYVIKRNDASNITCKSSA